MNAFEAHVMKLRESGLTSDASRLEMMARIERERKANRNERASAQAAPVGKRPHCQYCNRELRLYRYRKAGSRKLYGDYGDNLFCGLRCGWRWAIRRAGQ